MTEFPYVGPPDDGLRAAFAQARTRRFRTAGTSTSVLAAGIAAVALVVGGPTTQSLIQQPAPQQPAVNQLVPDDSNGSAITRTTPPIAHFSAAGQPLQALTTPLRGQVSGPGPDTTTPNVVLPGATNKATKPYSAGPISRNDGTINVPSCVTDGSARSDLCPEVYTSTSASTPPYQFEAYLCSTKTASTLLHFEGRNEVDFAIYAKNGAEVWRWSQWHRDDDAAHTLQLDTGTCTDWVFMWTGVDAHGRAVPKGDYTLKATYLAAELSGRRTQSTTFTLS